MSRSYSVLSQSRRTGLCVTVSLLALGAAGLSQAQAASFTAGTEQQFRDALAAAAASPDNQSTITLTAGFAVAAPIALPGKQILVDPAGFTVTNLTFSGTSGSFVIAGSGVTPLVGASTTAAFAVNDGEVRLESGAAVTASNSAAVGSSGRLVVDGVGSRLTTGTLTVGNPGGATELRVQNGGAVRATGVGAFASGGGAADILVTGAGSRMDFEAGLGLGTAIGTSNGSWTISDRGAATVAGGLIVGSQTLNQPTAPRVTVTGAGSTLGSGSLSFYRGEVSVLDGGELTTGALSVGPRLNNGKATVLVSDAGSRLVANGAVTLGVSPGQGIVTLARGGALRANSAFTVGSTATAVGVLNIGGGESDAAVAAGVLDTATVTLGAAGRLNFNHTGTDYAFAPTIAGAGTIKVAAGTTRLTGDSSGFTGTTSLAGGRLDIDGKLGGNLTVAAGTTLGGSGSIGGDVTVTGGAIAPGNSPGTLTIAGDLSLDPASTLEIEFGESNVVGGPMNDLIKVGGDLRLDGVVNIAVTAGGVFDAGLYRIASYGGTLDDQGLTIGAGGGAGISIQTVIPGQVNLVNTGGMPVNFWDGDGGGSANNSRVDGGAGTWTGAGLNWTTGTGAVNTAYTAADFLIFAGAPGAVNVGTVTTTGGLQFAVDGYRLTGGAITLSGTGRTIRVGDGTADGKNYVAIIDSPLVGASGGVTKTDLGTLILNGDNTYGFVTNVNAGTLLINGSVAGGGSALVVGVNGTIGGTGRSRGGVVSGTLAPGGLNAAGTLTFNGPLTLNASALLRYQLGQAGMAGGSLNDLTVVNGALTLNGTLNVTQSAGGSFLQGVYRLFDYTGILTDNVLDVGALPAGFTGVIQTSIANQVNLIASGAPPASGGGTGGGTTTPPPPPPEFTFWDGDGAAGDGAISGGDGVWRAGSGNWTTASGAQNGAFSDPRFAIFAGQGGTVTVDGSNGAIDVTGLQFAADGYRLAGDAVTLSAGDNVIRVGDGTTVGAQFVAVIAAELTGQGGLDKADAGTLILTGENSYGGGTRISGGALQIGDGGTTGSIRGDVANDGTLVFRRSDDVAFAGAISGAGTLAQQGAGTLSLTGDSSAFAGTSEVRAGTLAVDGKLGGVTSVHSGARLIGGGQLGGIVNQAGGVVSPGRGGLGVLTLAGGYVGAGGVLEMDATLGGDGAPADRLVVGGAVSGVTPIKINRLAGGTGALTADGILLVQVDGVSAAGAFTLADGDYRRGAENVLVAGAYGYVLRRDAEGGDWRLRSNLEPSELPGAPDAAPLYQPGVPIYEAYPQALQLLNGLGTMRERTGARQWSGEAGVGVWGRLEGGRTRLKPDESTTAANLKADRWKLQFGVEPLAAETGAGGVITAGLTGYLGGAKTKVGSPYGAGDIETKGYGLGANLTWMAAGGGYLDAQLQASWFDSDLSSSLLGARADGVSGEGLAAALEAGHGFAVGGLRLTPQAQVSYAKVDFDSFTDGFGAVVANDQSESLIARAGLGVDYALASGGGLYAVVDVSHEFLDGTAIDVSGAPVVSRLARTWGGLAAGGTYGWGEGRYTLYGEVSGDTSLSSFGDSYDFAGTAGFRVRF